MGEEFIHHHRTDEMWQKACVISRVTAVSVRAAERAGKIIRDTMRSGDLKIVDKADVGAKRDLQTEADRRAQFCILESLNRQFGKKLTVIGEEKLDSSTFIADADLEAGYSSDVAQLCEQKCPMSVKDIPLDRIVIWVDPLDGTSEFADAQNNPRLLQQVTVLIGITFDGRPVAGIVHQPFFNPQNITNDNDIVMGRTIWALKGCGVHGLDVASACERKVVVTTRSHRTEQVDQALDILLANKLADDIERVGGAGYKVLRCLDGAAAYVFASAGCKKWDTAAPEAILEEAGGCLTDISGRCLQYDSDVQRLNSGGVLATAPWIDHQKFVDAMPDTLKASLPESKL